MAALAPPPPPVSVYHQHPPSCYAPRKASGTTAALPAVSTPRTPASADAHQIRAEIPRPAPRSPPACATDPPLANHRQGRVAAALPVPAPPAPGGPTTARRRAPHPPSNAQLQPPSAAVRGRQIRPDHVRPRHPGAAPRSNQHRPTTPTQSRRAPPPVCLTPRGRHPAPPESLEGRGGDPATADAHGLCPAASAGSGKGGEGRWGVAAAGIRDPPGPLAGAARGTGEVSLAFSSVAGSLNLM
nr:atherin-like [Aegilops tauschii subsp. strangulata]